MIPVSHYVDQDVAVFGLGRSGIASARALAAGGARVFAWDDRAEGREAAEAEGIPLSDVYELEWPSLAALVLSPGIPLTHPEPHPVVQLATDAGRPVVGDIELFARARASLGLDNPVIAVTGTNGKSTTTALIGHLLETCGRPVAVGGNIGRPALDLNMLGANGIYVLEMSSYQIDLTTTSIADVGVLLNITPDHLDRHGDMTNYIRAKRRLLEMQGPEDTAVIGVDDAESARIFVAMRGRGEQRVIPFSASRMVEDGVYVQNGALYDGTSGTALLVADLAQNPAFVGTHNWQNAAAAVAALAALGIRGEAVKEGLLTFAGLAHRQEPIAEISGVQFVNDSKATNPVSAVRALSCYDRVYWIAGGRAKEGGLEELNPYLERVTKAYLIGAAEEQFANHLDGRAIYEKCGTLDVAVAKAARDAAQDRVPNAVILLSPACASFDQYKNFEERGEAFRKLVNALSAQTDNAADNPAGVAAGGQAK